MINPNKGLNKNINRYELPFNIYCSNCKKHICDSEWEMEQKLCMICSGQYDAILLRAGINKKSRNESG